MWLFSIAVIVAILLIQSPTSISIHANSYLNAEGTLVIYELAPQQSTSIDHFADADAPSNPITSVDDDAQIKEAETTYNVGEDSLHGFEYLSTGPNGDAAFPRVMADLYLLGLAKHGDDFNSHKDFTFFQNRTLLNKIRPDCYAVLRIHELYVIASLVDDEQLSDFFKGSSECAEVGDWKFLSNNY